MRWLVASAAVIAVTAAVVGGGTASSRPRFGLVANAPLAPWRLAALSSRSTLWSVDGGRRWVSHPLPSSGPGSWLTRIALLGRGDTVIGVDAIPHKSSSSLVRSTDGGRSWQVVQTMTEWDPGGWWFLLPDPVRARMAWACLPEEGLLMSADDGQTWARRSPAGLGCDAVDVRPDGRAIIAALERPTVSRSVVWRSTDLGLHWRRLASPAVRNPQTGQLDPHPWASLRYDPSEQSVVVGIDWWGNIFRSADGGASWRAVWTIYDETLTHGATSKPRWVAAGGGEWVQEAGGRFVAGPYEDEQSGPAGAIPPNYNLASVDHGVTWTMTVTCKLGGCQSVALGEPPAAVGGRLIAGGNVELTRHSEDWQVAPSTVTAG